MKEKEEKEQKHRKETACMPSEIWFPIFPSHIAHFVTTSPKRRDYLYDLWTL